MDLPVTTRPVRPDDAPLRQPPADAARLVEVDHDLREALVAVVGGEVIGVARYDRPADDPATAEVAVVVEDGWQGVGVGRQLLAELTELAARRGVRTLTADVQADNDRMVGLVRRLLPGAVLTPAHGVYAVQSPLPSAPVPAAA